MSGIFWEQERQPNLCEAASGFTFSTINLLVAIPMALLDLTLNGLLALWTLVISLLLPIFELLQSSLSALTELLGISLEAPVAADLVAPGLAVALLVSIYREHRQGASGIQLLSKWSMVATNFLWLAALFAGAAFAAAPGLVVVSLALGAASFMPGFLVAMAANFKPTNLASSAFGGLLEASEGLSTLLSLESGLVVVVAAFGSPELLGGRESAYEGAEWMQYLCALPFCACVLVYATLKQQEQSGSEVSPERAPVMNGSAIVAEREENIRGDTQESVLTAEVVEIESVDLANPAEEPNISVEQESVGPVQDDQPAPPVAEVATNDVAAELTPVQPADESQSGAAKQEEITVAVPTEVKENILLGKMRSRLGCMVHGVGCRLAALAGMLAAILAALGSLPWLSISLVLTTSGSQLLSAAAWSSVAANQAALLLPVFTLLLPSLLERCGSRLPAAWRSLASQLSGLAVAGLHFALVAGAEAEQE